MKYQQLDKQKTSFLIRHPDLAKNYICRHYPFSFEELKLYDNHLEWFEVGMNHNIPWSFEIIDYFIDKFNFKGNNNNYGPGFFCLNHGLPWNIEFIKRYEHLWDWNILMYNFKLRRNADIYKYMLDTYLNYTTKEDVKQALIKKSFNGSDHELRENYPEIDNFIYSTYRLIEGEPYISWKEVENNPVANWDQVSMYSFLPWSIDIIDKYKDKINFRNLCWNIAVPWSVELVFKYLSEFQESAQLGYYEKEINKNDFMCILCENRSFPWTFENVQALEEYISFNDLSNNFNVDWSIELLEYYEDKWEDIYLMCNTEIIPKAFPELQDYEVMNEVWEMIMKNHKKIE